MEPVIRNKDLEEYVMKLAEKSCWYMLTGKSILIVEGIKMWIEKHRGVIVISSGRETRPFIG